MNLFDIKLLYSPRIKHQLITGLAVAAWIWAFLFITKPLDVKELSPSEQVKYLIGYAALFFVAYGVTIPIQRKLYALSKQQWGWQYELATLLVLSIVMYGISYGFYRMVVIPNEPNPYSPRFFFVHRFLPVFTIAMPMLLLVRWLLGLSNRMTNAPQEISAKAAPQTITLQGVNQHEMLKVAPENLVSIEAANNYVKINYLVEGVVQHVLFRNKLGVYEAQLSFMIKTHRSYLANPAFFLKIRQANKRYWVVLQVGEMEVPVSKSMLNEVKSRFHSPQ